LPPTLARTPGIAIIYISLERRYGSSFKSGAVILDTLTPIYSDLMTIFDLSASALSPTFTYKYIVPDGLSLRISSAKISFDFI